MSEDTTQEVVETATPDEGQVETTETQGVEDVVDAQQGTETTLQSREDLEKEAEASMFDAIAAQKGWKSPEDMALAYKEAEAELTRRSQALSKTQEDYAAMEAVLEGLVNGDLIPEQITEDPYQPQIDPNYEKLRRMESKLDVRSVAERHPDFKDLQPLMSEILAETPNKEVFQGEKGVELLYKMAKADKYELELANAKKQGADEVKLAEIEKVRATVSDGPKAKTQTKQPITRDTLAQHASDPKWFEEHREEILSLERQGLL